MAIWANPSSPHAAGRKARAALENARERVKAALGWQGEVIFTSGASEALALAMTRCVMPAGAVSALEHDAVLRWAGDIVRLSVDERGQVDPAAAPAASLIVVQQVNNETGVIQSIAEIHRAVGEDGGLLLVDAAQGAGKLAIPEADMVALSAHKFGGPIGVGALLVRDWAMLQPTGGQERGYRGGTENLPAVLAMATALEADRGWLEDASSLRRKIETAVVEAGGDVIAACAPRLATIGAYRMPGVSANAQLIRFDAAGIALSAGSACSSGSLRTSHVLRAMNVEGAGEVIRVSLGRETSEEDVDTFIDAWRSIATGRRAA